MVNTADDEIGGARVREDLVYENIPARIEANMPSTLLLEQGLEADETFIMTVRPLNIREKDEIEVISPDVHRFYQKRLRITGIQASSMNARLSHTFYKVTLRRKDYAYAA